LHQPDCKNTRKLLKSGDAAPPKMDPVKMPELKCEKVNDTYILRDGASGLFLAASQFPKNRETRAPLVIEIVPHKDEIDPKYHFLCDAPKKDPDGRAGGHPLQPQDQGAIRADRSRRQAYRLEGLLRRRQVEG
jgi:ssDNA-binding Zn-finger/Zn-ribbon topoisomerase 1